jgi:hypothetical protein
MKMPSIGLEPDPPRSERDRTVMKKAAGPPVKIGRRPIFIVAVLALALAAWTISAEAQPPAATAKADAGALAALDKMGAYLRTLKEFQVVATTTAEEVLDDGQKIQFGGVVNFVVRFPDRLRAEVANDRQERLYLYDGKNFTLYAQRIDYYATISAPPTIRQLADLLEEKYGIEVPLADLFLWGAPGVKPDNITAAVDIGPSSVLGVTCEQYAFRQAGLDWQVWIQKGDYPLPRKLVLTTLTDEARPQHTATYVWNLAPSINEGAFIFAPPSTAKRIVFAEDTPAAGAGSTK